MHFMIAVMFFVGLAPALVATPRTLVIDQGFNREELGNYFDLFIDQSREVKFPDVVSETNGVQLSPTPTTRFKSSDAAYWGRFQVENATDRDIELFVEFPYPALDYLTFYEPAGKNLLRPRISARQTTDCASRSSY